MSCLNWFSISYLNSLTFDIFLFYYLSNFPVAFNKAADPRQNEFIGNCIILNGLFDQNTLFLIGDIYQKLSLIQVEALSRYKGCGLRTA